MAPHRIVYVPRTHFDLAWWLSHTLFRHRFAPVMDELVAALEREPRLRFTLDGQAELALWWLEATTMPAERRTREQRLVNLVRQGRLQVGPALVLPDAFLAPGEALVRNLLLGGEIARQLDAPPPQVADMSDLFGHPAQTPQITAGFGLPYYMFTRGLGDEGRQLNPAFRWRAPDGSLVVGLPQQGGYGNGYQFGRQSWLVSRAAIATFLARYRHRYDRVGLTSLLLCGGGDHTALGGRILADVARAQAAWPDIDFAVGTNDEYAATIDQSRLRLAQWAGDLYGSAEQNLLRGVNSTRMYLKQLNERVFRLIVQAETACSLAVLKRGGHYQYPLEAFRLLWRQFLVLQSHDAITGCHIDDVSDDMLRLYDQLEQVANRLLQEGLNGVMGRPAAYEFAHRRGLPPAKAFSLWNPLPYDRAEVAVVDLPPSLHGARPLTATVDGAARPVQRLGDTQAAVPVAMAGFGSVQLRLGRRRWGGSRPAAPTSDRAIENEHLRVSVADNGLVIVTDRATGRRVTAHRLESVGDRGDSYNFDPVPGHRFNSAGERATVRRLSAGPLVGELEITLVARLPEGLDSRARASRWRLSWVAGQALRVPGVLDNQFALVHTPSWLTRRLRRGLGNLQRLAASHDSRMSRRLVEVPIRTVVRLRRGSRVAEFETTVGNQARDHRLQVVFGAGQTVATTQADTAFLLQTYPVTEPTDPRWKTSSTWQEPPFSTRAQHGLVAAGPMAIFTRGLPEYEARQSPTGTEVAVTLLRGISHLSHDDLTTRHGGAGPSLPIPGAQCQGRFTAAYAVGFAGQQSPTALLRAAQLWRHHLVVGPPGLNTNGICAPTGDWVFSALKGAENGDGVILRLYAGDRPAQLSSSGRQPLRLQLDEAPHDEPTLVIQSHQIATFRLR